jgi:drug/metabolite transporter (DMT)-like permease
MSQKPKAPLGASLIAVSSFFYASYGIWTKLMGDFFGGYTASGLRSTLVILLILPLAFVIKILNQLIGSITVQN